MSIKTIMIGSLFGLILAQAGLGFGEVVSDRVREIMNSETLTMAEKIDQASDAIMNSNLSLKQKETLVILLSRDAGAAAGGLVDAVVSLTEENDLNSMVSVTVIATTVNDVAGSPAILTDLVVASSPDVAELIVAAACLSSLSTGLDTEEFATLIENAGLPIDLLNRLRDVAHDPTSVLSAQDVQKSLDLVSKVLEKDSYFQGSINTHGFGKHITGYGFQTSQ